MTLDPVFAVEGGQRYAAEGTAGHQAVAGGDDYQVRGGTQVVEDSLTSTKSTVETARESS